MPVWAVLSVLKSTVTSAMKEATKSRGKSINPRRLKEKKYVPRWNFSQ